MKRRMRWSMFPKYIWLQWVFVKPCEDRVSWIPSKTKPGKIEPYLILKGYPYSEDRKRYAIVEFSFPLNIITWAMASLNTRTIEAMQGHDVYMEIRKIRRGRMEIRNVKVI